jgi:nucleotide-binding universal stress UspA family protein
MVYKKILVPYDISKPADNALEHAIKLEKVSSNETEIILLHVIPEIPIYPVIEQAIRSRKDSRVTDFEEHTRHVYSSMKNEVTRILDQKKREHEQRGLKRQFQGRFIAQFYRH